MYFFLLLVQTASDVIVAVCGHAKLHDTTTPIPKKSWDAVLKVNKKECNDLQIHFNFYSTKYSTKWIYYVKIFNFFCKYTFIWWLLHLKKLG